MSLLSELMEFRNCRIDDPAIASTIVDYMFSLDADTPGLQPLKSYGQSFSGFRRYVYDDVINMSFVKATYSIHFDGQFTSTDSVDGYISNNQLIVIFGIKRCLSDADIVVEPMVRAYHYNDTAMQHMNERLLEINASTAFSLSNICYRHSHEYGFGLTLGSLMPSMIKSANKLAC